MEWWGWVVRKHLAGVDGLGLECGNLPMPTLEGSILNARVRTNHPKCFKKFVKLCWRQSQRTEVLEQGKV